MNQGELMIDGKLVAVPFKVVRWDQPGGLGYDEHPANFKARNRKPDLFVLHWDVCPSSKVCHEVLIDRGLSVHLLVDGDDDATVYQCLDLARYTAQHAAPENWRSVGVEINNPVVIHDDIKTDRPVAEAQPKANGREVWSHYDFTEAQRVRVVQLTTAICEALNIPKVIPSAGGKVDKMQPGVVGHYHITTAKIDPGFTLWPAFEAAGFKREAW